MVATLCLHRASVKWLPLILASVAATSCTTLENRRDLYRSPAEGYERWHQHPPPTRLPSMTPGARSSTTTTTTTERHGVIMFPEETPLPDNGQ